MGMVASMPTCRRWSFSLRTLFVVVTVLAVLLGWIPYQLNWIQERRAAPSLATWYRLYTKSAFDTLLSESPPPRAPGLLWLFGERGHTRCRLYFGTEPRDFSYFTRELTPLEESEVARIKRLFQRHGSRPRQSCPWQVDCNGWSNAATEQH